MQERPLLRIIMQELSADSGTVVLARDKKISAILPSTKISTDIATIYGELLTTKQHIIDINRRRIRNMERNEHGDR